MFRDNGENNEPQGVTRPRFQTTSKPTNVVFNLQGLLGDGMTNEFKFGYNAREVDRERRDAGAGFEGIALNLSGIGRQRRHRRPGRHVGLASPGGLVRVNSAGNGRGAPYNPYSLTFADSLSTRHGHPLREVRRRRRASSG